MDNLQELWQLIATVWNAGSYGIGGGNLIGALGIFLFFAVLRGLFTRFVLSFFNRLTQRTRTNIDDLLLEALKKPLKFFFLILGAFFGFEFLNLTGLPAELADKSLRTLIAIGIFWSFYEAVSPLSELLEKIQEILSQEIINWLKTVMRSGVVLMGLATILQIWGIEIAPIIAGFGLFGVAVALGAQDLFKNLLGGLSILVEKRFKIGDNVQVTGVVHGHVEHIGFRSTRIRQFDKVAVTVPNNMFSDHAVVNYSTMTNRRIYWQIGLEYRTSVAQMKEIRDNILNWLKANEHFVSDDEDVACTVYVDSFNASSIDMMVYCFTRTTDWDEWHQHKQDLAFAIKEIVENAGTGFAFPSQSLYIETPTNVVLDDAPEAFVPPEETENKKG